MQEFSRRSFLAGAGMTAAACAARPLFGKAAASGSPFKVAVSTDEISQDFDHACSVISKDFGLGWAELRGMWKKSLHELSDTELGQVESILAKYNLRVTDMASPLFKTDWPGAPKRHPDKSQDFGSNETFKQQDELLAKYIDLAKRFKTNKIRCFDFWRLADVKPYRAAINAKLAETAATCGKQGMLLVLENEFECNTATGREAAETLAGVPSPYFGMNWDPGNAVMRGELDAYPAGWNLLPKKRIFHCHVKSAIKDASGKTVWAPVGKGYVDWTAQFRALKQIGYHQAVSLETHWRGGGTPEESTRISFAGMKQALEASGTW